MDIKLLELITEKNLNFELLLKNKKIKLHVELPSTNMASSIMNGLMSKEDKEFLDGININSSGINLNSIGKFKIDNKEVKAKKSADNINIVGENNLVISPNLDDKKINLEIKLNNATQFSDGLVSTNDKNKINNMSTLAEENQNTFSIFKIDNKLINANNTTDILTIKSDDTLKIIADSNTHRINMGTNYNLATTSKKGLMSKLDKIKLDSIKDRSEENQNAFVSIVNGNKIINAEDKLDTLNITTDDTINLNNNSGIIEFNSNLPNATKFKDGLMSKEDKEKLNSIQNKAQVNKSLFNSFKFKNNILSADNTKDILKLLSLNGIKYELDLENRKIILKPNIIGSNGVSIEYNEIDKVLDIIGLDNANNTSFTNELRTKLDNVSNNAKENRKIFNKIKIGSKIITANNKESILDVISTNDDKFNIKVENNRLKINSKVEKNNKCFDKFAFINSDGTNDSISMQDRPFEFKLETKNIDIGLNEKKLFIADQELEENQEAFSNIKIGNKIISAKDKADIINMISSNNSIFISPSTNDPKDVIIKLTEESKEAKPTVFLKNININDGNTIHKYNAKSIDDKIKIKSNSYVNTYLNVSILLNEPAIYINRSNSSYKKVMIINDATEINSIENNTLVFNRENLTFTYKS